MILTFKRLTISIRLSAQACDHLETTDVWAEILCFRQICWKFNDKHFWSDNEPRTKASYCPLNHRFTMNSFVKLLHHNRFWVNWLFCSEIHSKCIVYIRNQLNGDCSTFYCIFHSMKYAFSCLFPRSTSMKNTIFFFQNFVSFVCFSSSYESISSILFFIIRTHEHKN